MNKIQKYIPVPAIINDDEIIPIWDRTKVNYDSTTKGLNINDTIYKHHYYSTVLFNMETCELHKGHDIQIFDETKFGVDEHVYTIEGDDVVEHIITDKQFIKTNTFTQTYDELRVSHPYIFINTIENKYGKDELFYIIQHRVIYILDNNKSIEEYELYKKRKRI